MQKPFTIDDARSLRGHMAHVPWNGPRVRDEVEAFFWLEQTLADGSGWRQIRAALVRRGHAPNLAFQARKDLDIGSFGQAAGLETLGAEMSLLIGCIKDITVEIGGDQVITMTLAIPDCPGGVLKARAAGPTQLWDWFVHPSEMSEERKAA